MDSTTTNYNKQYHTAVHRVDAKEYGIISKYRAKKLQPFISGSDTVLEYGVGNAWNLAALNCKEKYGYDVYIDKTFCEPMQMDLFTDLNYIFGKRFDKIICHHVIEHVNNPFQTLVQVKGFLKTSGLLICYVPYREKDTWKKTFDVGNKNKHLYSWNVQTFCMLLHEAGYSIKKCSVKRTGFDRFAAVCISKYKLPTAAYKILRSCLQFIKPDYEIELVAGSR